jgi:putative addiction module component (TIGR02574 family)
MTQAAQNIFNQAIKLAPIEKAELIDLLFMSFDRETRNSVDAKWRVEVEDRVKAFDKGKIPSDSFDNVFERLGKK